MQMRTLVDMILARCQDLGLKGVDSGQVDAAAVEFMLLYIIQGLVDSWDFPAMTHDDDSQPLFTTRVGEGQYALPDDFGRLCFPRQDDVSGIWLHDGTVEWPLRYREPLAFRRQQQDTVGRPQYVTLVSQSRLRLDPRPDGNGTVGYYTGRGIYILAVDSGLLEGQVPFAQPASLVDMTIARLVVDRTHPQAQLLLGQGEQARQHLVNANVRTRQRFHPESARRWPVTQLR